LHPSEDDKFYQEMMHFPNFRVLPKTTTLEQAVTEADVACTLWSTSGLEAMMMRRPLVVLDLDPMIYDLAWWPKGGGGVYISSIEALQGFVKNASSDVQFLREIVAQQNEFLGQSYAHPGAAAEAALDAIAEGAPLGNRLSAQEPVSTLS
jgi:hypothetical protein